jgi:dTDP-4-dehydrorhamnose reductase
MDPSKLLIIGANGQLGKALQDNYPEAVAVDSDGLDIIDRKAVDAYDWSNVHVILNAAAYTNVDGAETLKGRVAAWKVNAVGAANLAYAADKYDLTLVHISTDYVFDGSVWPHLEDEPFSPLGVYGQAKAAGDITVANVPKHYVLRTSWVIGEGKNFVQTMIGLGEKGISPIVVADQIGRLTFTSELVKAINHLLTTLPAYGTYNVSNGGGEASWADITREIFAESGYDLTVTNTTTDEYFATKDGVAPRPLRSTLSLAKLQATGFVSTDWKDDLATYISRQGVPS